MHYLLMNLPLVLFILSSFNVQSQPITANDTATTTATSSENKNPSEQNAETNAQTTFNPEPSQPTSEAKEPNSLENKLPPNAEGNAEQAAVPENTSDATGATYDPSVYSGILTPDAFQQYVQQFGAAYAPYPAYAAPGYPGYAMQQPGQALYPSPIIVQTGYEGFLVPTTSPAVVDPGTASKEVISGGPFSFLANLISSILMSTIFRIFAAVASAIGMAFFGSAIVNAICNLTSLCRTMKKISSEVTPERVGKLLAEEMTPDRVRRTAEFVRDALRKYRELQQLTAGEQAK